MDKTEFTVIESKAASEVKPEKEVKAKHQTNPIVKKLAKFHLEKAETFSVKDLFKKQVCTILKIKSSEYLDDENFRREAVMYLKECRKYYDYRKSQEPIIQAQKEFEKKKRAFLREVKMSHEEPTKKQKYYYERLCKKYGIEQRELKSKLEARDEIDRIIKEHEKENLGVFDGNQHNKGFCRKFSKSLFSGCPSKACII